MAFISIPTSIGGVNIPGKIGNILSGPLSKLFGSEGLSTLKYPLDLGTDATKLHYVQFFVSEVIPAGWTNAPGNQARMELAGVKEIAGGIFNVIESTANAWSNYTHNIDIGPINSIVSESKNVLTKFSDALSNGIAITPRSTKMKAVISLYMPDTIDAAYNSEYVDMSLSDDLGKVRDLRLITQLAGTGIDGISSNLTDTLKNLGNIVSTDPGVVELISSALGVENLSALVLKGRGAAINPQLQMIYKGIDLRNFQLTFTFTPRSAQEAKEVNDIIYTFKRHYVPRLEAGKQTSVNSMFLTPPSIFKVNFMNDGHENPNLPKYGDCVLTNIDVNYTPNGFATYGDGSSVQIMLNLNFRETEILDQNRIDIGYKFPQDTRGLR